MFLRTVICFTALCGSSWTHEQNKDESMQHSSLPYLSYVHDLTGGSKIYVFDQMLTKDEFQVLQYYFSYHTEQNLYTHQVEDNIAMGLTPFYGIVNKSEVEDFKFLTDAKHLLEKSLGAKVYLQDIHGEFLHSLDPKPPGHDDCNEHSYSGILFLNEFWLHNSYGQVSFYATHKNPNMNNEPRLEVEQTIHPKPGRMIIWPSCLTYSSHPPSVNFFGNIYILKVRFTTERTDSDDFSDSTVSGSIENSGNPIIEFGIKDINKEIDYAKHLKRSFYDSENRGIHVFDDLYTIDELKAILKYLLSAGKPLMSQYDGNAIEDHDNVQWLALFNVSEYVKSPAWKRLQEMLNFVSGEDGWYPYDVALNLVRPADHTRIHPDAEEFQIEYTCLLYLSENVTQNDFGETVWFEKVSESNSDGIHDFTNPGGEEYEPIASVWPKFGRVVLFRNVIEHSARPLSTSYLVSRYSFAVKVSQTKRKSVVKQLYESMERVDDITDELQDLNDELQGGAHDLAEDSELTTEMLEKQLENTKSSVVESFKQEKTQIMDQLKIH